MSTSHVLQSSVQNQQHPFLFQPQHHQYSSGDDVDSPPSLTNSSESPRSASEEGESASPPYNTFDRPHTNRIKQGAIGNGREEQQLQKGVKDIKREGSDFNGSVIEEGEDSLMSPPIQAVSPNWDSVFASSNGGDEMDLNASVVETENKQWRPTPDGKITSTPTINSSNGGASDEEIKAVMARSGGMDLWSNEAFGNSLQNWPQNQSNGDNRVNDEAMFDSLIQEDSFEQSNSSQADTSMQHKSMDQGNEHLSINTTPASLPTPFQTQQSATSASAITPPQSAQPSTSALSSRRNSNEQDAKQKTAKVPHCGSHYSHTSDADLPTSSQVVVKPPQSELTGLQVHVHGISFSGAKSRVETQIRTRIELVRPVPGEAKDGSPAFERVGSFNHVKLPPLTGTKRKSKKHKPSDIAAEKTLFMDATVVRATPPHDRVLVCASCQQRERKRAQRKRTGSRKSDQKIFDEEAFSVEELQEYGIDPNAPDAQEQAQDRASQEDEKRVVVFNCGDFINFEEGACVLPTRITCYCRHHKEKTGFCLIFTMRDYRGNLIATGSTPPIMITDDHKSVAAAQNAAAAITPSSSANKRVEGGVRSRGVSTEAVDESSMRSNIRDSIKKKRNHRARPYGDADDRASRKNTLQSSSMTPYTSTGQNTPAVGQSPPTQQTDLNHPEFWNAFAAMSTMATSPPVSSHTSNSNGDRTPHDITSPINHTSPLQQQTNMNGHDWMASIANQGSLSSQTLDLSPQSLPGFDLNSFTRSLQQSSNQAGDEATMQQLLMLARSMPGMTSNTFNNAEMPQIGQMGSNSSPLPVPTISKLIPGEGPTSGGIEVTVLGENFTENLTCLFGDVAATSTKVWGSNTLLCILPPSASPGPVAVSIKGTYGEEQPTNGQDRYGRSLQLFTYIDATDRALMELALQVVGLQMTGQMQTARDVAMRVVGSGPNQGMTRTHEGRSQPQSEQRQQSQIRSAVPGLFASGMSNQSFQDSVLQFLKTLDEDVGVQRRDAIRLANKQGHTLLHLTVMMGFHRLALDLIQRGCPINARDNNGFTPLHFAALHGRMTIARLLLNHGARVDVECESGKYPIDVAREKEQVDVEVLLEEFMGESISEDESLWSTDEEEIDADNISTQVDESVAAEYSSDEIDDDDDDDENVDEEELNEEGIVKVDGDRDVTPHCSSPATPLEDEKASLKAAEAASESMTKSLEAKFGFKGLVSGGMDLAQKLQLPHAGIGKIGMPSALHERFNLMQMPTVSVFQMVLPPNFMSWTSAAEDSSSSSNVDKGKEKEQEQVEATKGPTAEESSRALTMWRNILEESALWINPLYCPPPTYESTLQERGERVIKEEKGSRGQSRFPAIAQASPDTPHKDYDDELRRRKMTGSNRQDNNKDNSNTQSASWNQDRPASTSSSSTRSTSKSSAPIRRPLSASSSSSSPSSSSSTTIAPPPPRQLKEDRMLVYFWLPALIFVILLLCFAKPSSVLSYKDLISFMPV